MNTLVAIIAVASIVQVILLTTIAVFAFRRLNPLTRHVHEVLGQMHTELARLGRAGDRVQHAASIVKSTVWPGWALSQGVLAAISAFGGKRGRQG